MSDVTETGDETGAPRGKRRVRRTTAEVRRLILDAALECFAERGFAGTATRQIAERAQVAEPLIFNNFGSKADLFEEAVIAPFNARFVEYVESLGRQPEGRELRSAQFVHLAYPFLRDNAALLHALVRSGSDIAGSRLGGLDAYFARSAQTVRDQYAKWGWVPDVPPELLVRYTFGMLAGAVLLRDWFFPEGAPDEASAEAALARMLFKASEPKDGPTDPGKTPSHR